MIIGILGFVVGTVLGSLAYALAGRIIKGASFWKRSHCLRCKKTLRARDLFPVVSYIFLKGRCRYCHKKISIEYLLYEAGMGVLVGLLFMFSMPDGTILSLLELSYKSYFLVVLMVIFLVDLKVGLIPDRITYPAVVVTLIYLLIDKGARSWNFYQSIMELPFGKYLLPPYSAYLFDNLARLWNPILWALLSAVGLSLFFALLIIITRGRGMGWGDVKYVFFLGLALGFPSAIIAVFLAFLAGAITSLILIAIKKKRFGQTIPFGPFLSLGALVTVLWGDKVMRWYL